MSQEGLKGSLSLSLFSLTHMHSTIATLAGDKQMATHRKLAVKRLLSLSLSLSKFQKVNDAPVSLPLIVSPCHYQTFRYSESKLVEKKHEPAMNPKLFFSSACISITLSAELLFQKAKKLSLRQNLKHSRPVIKDLIALIVEH